MLTSHGGCSPGRVRHSGSGRAREASWVAGCSHAMACCALSARRRSITLTSTLGRIQQLDVEQKLRLVMSPIGDMESWTLIQGWRPMTGSYTIMESVPQTKLTLRESCRRITEFLRGGAFNYGFRFKCPIFPSPKPAWGMI